MAGPELRDEDFIACARITIRIKAKQIVKNNGTKFGYAKDVRQELTLYLLSRKHKFDPKRGALTTFVATVIESGVKMLLRDACRIKRKPPSRLKSLEETVRDRGGEVSLLGNVLSPEDGHRRLRKGEGILGDIESRATFDEAMASLPEELRDVAERLKWQSEAAIARAMSVSKQRIKSARDQIRLHFEKYGLGNIQESAPGPRGNGIDNNQADVIPPDGDDL